MLLQPEQALKLVFRISWGLVNADSWAPLSEKLTADLGWGAGVRLVSPKGALMWLGPLWGVRVL